MIRVMIVEDQVSSAERYASYINAFGHGFVVTSICRQASKALDELKKNPPDVVFSDIRMPGENGLSMLDRFRRSGWEGQAVIVSGYDDFAYAQQAIRVRTAEYMLKPVFPDDMNRTLKELLARFEEDPADAIQSTLLNSSQGWLPPFVKRALDYISMHYSDRFSLLDAAKYAFVCSAYLSSSFKKSIGYTFVEYVRRYRIGIAKNLLTSSNMPIEQVAVRVGIGDAAYFNKLFKRVEGTTPGKYRRERNTSQRSLSR
jgi:YesN/AraC family two-component response regulator